MLHRQSGQRSQNSGGSFPGLTRTLALTLALALTQTLTLTLTLLTLAQRTLTLTLTLTHAGCCNLPGLCGEGGVATVRVRVMDSLLFYITIYGNSYVLI